MGIGMSKPKHNDFEDEEIIGEPPKENIFYTDGELERMKEAEDEDGDEDDFFDEGEVEL